MNPGESPFHVRGVFYADMLDDAKSLPGGVEHFLDEIVDPRVRDFMRQRFQFMSWYDACPALPCAATIARIRNQPVQTSMREMGRTYVRRLVPTMFRIFSQFGSPRFAAAHAPRLFQVYFDFVDLSILHVTDCDGTGTLGGVPVYLAPVMLDHIAGLITGALESLGARDVGASFRDVAVSRAPSGFDVVTCHGDFNWTLERSSPSVRPR